MAKEGLVDGDAGEQGICPRCRSSSYEVVLTDAGRRQVASSRHDLVRCNSCGLVRLRPLPNELELAEHFGDIYWEWIEPRSILAGGLVRGWHWWLARGIAAAAPRGGNSVLEVGCGDGELLAAVRDRLGWSALGMELNLEAAQKARERFGLTVLSAPLQKCELPERTFDLVVMRYVLEHLRDPVGSIERVARLVSPRGRLLVWVPNADSLEAKLLGHYWGEIRVPIHPFIYSVRSLKRLLAQVGMRITSVTHSPEPTTGLRRSIGDLKKEEMIPSPHSLSPLTHSRLRRFSLPAWRPHSYGHPGGSE